MSVFALGLSVAGPRHLGSSASMQVHHVVCAHVRILLGGISTLLCAILTSHVHSTDVRPFMAVIGDNRDGAALLLDGEHDRHVTQRILCQHRMHDPLCMAHARCVSHLHWRLRHCLAAYSCAGSTSDTRSRSHRQACTFAALQQSEQGPQLVARLAADCRQVVMIVVGLCGSCLGVNACICTQYI